MIYFGNSKSNIFCHQGDIMLFTCFFFFYITDVHLGPFPILNKSQTHQLIPINLIPCSKNLRKPTNKTEA